jgi:FtsZ-binding cell division protein ZapB
MISEFHQLSEKIGQLAELTHTLRRENAQLRLRTTGLQSENEELKQRIGEAHQRVAALLEKFPALPQESQDRELT